MTWYKWDNVDLFPLCPLCARSRPIFKKVRPNATVETQRIQRSVVKEGLTLAEGKCLWGCGFWAIIPKEWLVMKRK